MGNLTEVKTTFTIDLSPYLSGLKSMLTMTQQTGAQLKPLLNLQIDNASFSELEKTYEQYLQQVKSSIPVTNDAADASMKLGSAHIVESKETEKTNKTQNEREITLKRSKRDALEAYGAVMFLTQGVIRLASSTTGGNKELEKLNRAMSEGVGQGFELAGLMSMLKIASGGTAVAIGAVVTIAVTLTRVLGEMEDATKRNEQIQNDFARSLNGMTIPQLEAYRKAISQAIEQNNKFLEAEKKRIASDNYSISGTMNIVNAFLQLIGVKEGLKEIEESLNRTREEGKAIDDLINSKVKTHAEIQQFIIDARIDSIIRSNDKQRAEAKKTFDEEIVMINESMATSTKKDEATAASRAKYNAIIHQISIQERQEALQNSKDITDAYIKAANDRAEIELNIRRAGMIMQGVESETIELRAIQARKARYQQQYEEISKIAGPVGPKTLQKQIEIESQISQLELQEANKRKSIKENEREYIDRLSSLQLQEVLSRVRLRGLEAGKSEEQINQDILGRKRMAVQSELALIIKSEDEGRILDAKTIERKQELENALIELSIEGADMRISAAKRERQIVLEGIQSIASNMENMFGSLFQLEQQRTVKIVGEEKKRRQATLDAEKDRRMAAATTVDERSAIEKEYSDKKSALDAEMDAKARSQMQTMFALQKASQIANAMIATYSAAAAALAPPPLGLGPVFGPAVAAAAIAAGLANIAVIAAQEVPGLAEGTRISSPTFALLGEAGPEIVAPERTFIDVFKTDLAPRLIDVLAPQIEKSIIDKITLYGGAGQIQYIAQIHIESFSGNDDDFEKLKMTVEDAMRLAGTDNANDLFRNQKRT